MEVNKERKHYLVAERSPYGWQLDEGRDSLRVALASDEGYVRALCFSKEMDDKLKEGLSIYVKDVLMKDQVIYITRKSSIFRAPKLKIDQTILSAAKKSILEPLHEEVHLVEVARSPVKRKISVTGTISGLEDMKKVKVRGSNKDIREMTISQDDTRVKVTLWPPACNTMLQIGKDVKVKDATVHYNTYFKENVLTVANVEDIELVESSQKVVECTLLGVENDEVEQQLRILAQSTEEKVVQVPLKLLLDKLFLDDNATLDDILDCFPFTAMCRFNGNDIVCFE